MNKVILGLGCNLGDREKNLNAAISLIENGLLDNVVRSSVYETPPMLPPNAPESWNISFLNMVIAGDLKKQTTPEEFLSQIKAFEKEIGRKPTERWAPREIDIDILLWGSEIYDSGELHIPHVGILEREFVVKPLLELFPDLLHPEKKDYIRNLYTG